MEKKEETNVGIVLHSVGNKIGSTRGRYIFARDKSYNAEETKSYVDAENARREATEQLEKLICHEGDDNPDQAMSAFLESLKASDWSTEESFLSFKTEVFDPFTSSGESESARKIRDRLFRKSGLH